jgi:DNA-3-methyladenine glycosylase II
VRPNFWAKAKLELAQRDVVMEGIIRAFPRIGLESRGDPFRTLARSIVGQQISVKAAASIWGRLMVVAPQMQPDEIVATSFEDLRLCGLSYRKAEYLHDLAHGFLTGSLRVQEWVHLDDESVIADLVKVRGIGRWTAEMFLMFNLTRPDILPLDDRGLQNAIRHYYFLGDPVPRHCARELADSWRPWRSVATWYLWRSLEAVPGDY